MGIGEQIQEVREELAKLHGLIDENRRAGLVLDQRIEVLKIESRESLAQLGRLHQENLLGLEQKLKAFEQRSVESDERLAGRDEVLQRDLKILNDNQAAMSDFEKQQEGRIAQVQTNFQTQFKVLMEELAQENQRLQGNITTLQKDMEQIQNILNQTNSRLQDLYKKVAALASGQLQQQPQKPDFHVVKKGETLLAIAERYGVSIQALLEKNQISDPNTIQEGRRLIIPGR
jgi:LysM repeat protein